MKFKLIESNSVGMMDLADDTLGDRYRCLSLFCAPRYRWTSNFKMYLMELGCEDDTWTDLFVNTVGTRLQLLQIIII